MRRLLAAIAVVTVLLIFTRPGASAGQSHVDIYDACLEQAVESADSRASAGEGSVATRFVWFSLDVAACTFNFASPFKL